MKAPSSWRTCAAGHGPSLQQLPGCRPPHAAVDVSRCICQPDVSSSKWGEEELPGCQLASNGVDDATGNGPGLEVEAAVC